MLELLSPAGSPEAVIAAVQNGADAVYFGLGNYNARRGAKNFTEDEFERAVQYCRVRGCKAYLTMNTVVSDREIEEATHIARFASKCGIDAIIIQDIGLISVLKAAVPDMPLHGSTQMSVHNLAGAEAAAEMGLSRIVLARELSAEQIKFIAKNTRIETEIFVHGALCFCYSGQCYMSAFIGRRSGNRGMCAQPCRMQYSLGGRMDNYPMSLKDNCLIEYLNQIEDIGVTCVKIEGRMKRPEYTAVVTDIYSKVIKEKRAVTEKELETLKKVFSRDGFTQGYFLGDKKDMFGVKSELDDDIEKYYSQVRKEYSDKEIRRVPIHFYTVIEKDKKISAIAFDDDGYKASAIGSMPQIADNKSIDESYVIEQMYKTGGTPYLVVENKAKVDPGLFVPASEINDLRRKLISSISDERGKPVKFNNGAIPAPPKDLEAISDPCLIFEVRDAEQLSREMAALHPAYIYVPMEVMHNNFALLDPFFENNCIPVVVLPRVITDNQVEDVKAKLKALHEMGINEALVGNMGHIFLAKGAGLKMRGDFGLNVFNSYSLDVLSKAGFASATASFELRLSQIRDMYKPINTEILIYGRVPLMVSEQCIIKESSGRCSCQQPTQMADRMGSVFPVAKEYGCRNVIYNAHKLYLADKKEDINACGLWGIRMLFTTEGARECVEVIRGYKGLSDYKPNVLTRGLYYRGVD